MEKDNAVMIAIDKILPNEFAREVDPSCLKELEDSIAEHDVITPIIVREEGDAYRIVVGDRRWRAAKLAGLKEIPATIQQ